MANRNPAQDSLSEQEEFEFRARAEQEASGASSFGGGEVTEQPLDEVSFLDRLKVKATGSPDASLEYLRKNYPQLNIKRSNDRIIGKTSGEENYRVLDPNQGFSGLFSKETLKDVAEAVPELALSTGGQWGGELAGALGGAGLGAMTGPLAPVAVPALAFGGKVLGGGIGSAASEAARQSIGSALGIENNIDPEEIKSAAESGALTSALFSSTIPGATKASKGLLKGNEVKGLPYAAYSTAKNKFGPEFSEMLSGVPSQAIKNYRDKFSEAVNELDKRTDFSNIIGDIKDKFKSTVQTPLDKIGKKINYVSRSIDEKTKKASGEALDAAADRAYAQVGELEKRLELLNSDKAKKIAEMLGTTKKAVKDERKILKENIKLSNSAAKTLDKVKPSAGLINKEELLAPIESFKQSTIEKYGGPEGIAGTDIPQLFAELDKMAKEAFGDENNISIQKALQVKQKLKEFANITKEGGPQLSKTTSEAMQVNSWRDVIKNIDNKVDEIADTHGMPDLKQLRDDYSVLADARRIVNKFDKKDKLLPYKDLLKDPEMAALFKEADLVSGKYGKPEIKKVADFMTTYAHLGEPSVDKVSLGHKMISNIAAPIVGASGGYMANKLQQESDIPWWVTLGLGGATGLYAGKKFGSVKGIKNTYNPQQSAWESIIGKTISPGIMGIRSLMRNTEEGEDQ